MAHILQDTSRIADRNQLGDLQKQYSTDMTMGISCLVTTGLLLAAGIVGIVSAQNTPALEKILFPVLIVVIFVAMYNNIVYSRHEHVDVYERGLIACMVGRGYEVVRWPDIKNMRNESLGRGGTRVYVTLQNGKQIVLNSTLSHFDELHGIIQLHAHY